MVEWPACNAENVRSCGRQSALFCNRPRNTAHRHGMRDFFCSVRRYLAWHRKRDGTYRFEVCADGPLFPGGYPARVSQASDRLGTAAAQGSAYYHDSAAALVIDGEVIAAAREERFTRKKFDAAFPRHALEFVLSQGRLRLEDLNALAFYEKPYLKFGRLLETHLSFAPRGRASFLAAIPVWIK
jgi:hypothetical protein